MLIKLKCSPGFKLLLCLIKPTLQVIHSFPRVLDHSTVTRASGPLLSFPTLKKVQKVSHRSSNTRIIQVSTSYSTFSPQRITTTIPKLQKLKENPSTHLEIHHTSFICTTVSDMLTQYNWFSKRMLLYPPKIIPNYNSNSYHCYRKQCHLIL